MYIMSEIYVREAPESLVKISEKNLGDIEGTERRGISPPYEA